ncbi:MAG: class I SAM-dependent DNA methyltransferase [Chloroflexota bacterium]|nr:class I SAM-dependent DNA methyltransferase [Chloroflexota bacterium]
MTAAEFIKRWSRVTQSEKAVAQSHFNELCRLLGEPTPVEADPEGEEYCFERGAAKDSGGDGWADVWKRGHFAWEYKSPGKDLDAAFQQLRQYALALENPPLLIVSDMRDFRIHTNWTNSVSKVYEFSIYDLDDPEYRNKLKWAFSDPERLRPEQTRQALTEQAAATFAEVAKGLREEGEDPQTVAHFINRLVFCMFAEDVGLLPDQMFRRMLDQARLRPERFAGMARSLFAAMKDRGAVGFEEVPWFNGSLFDDDTALPLDRPQVNAVREAAGLDWSEIDPSILGTLFERGLDPDKRSQLGAHYTDRDKIMQIVDPVIVRPWLAEWEVCKEELKELVDRSEEAKTTQTASNWRQRAARQLREFLERVAEFRVLDPACGSGNFLYLALHALKDLEHRVRVEAQTLGLQPPFPAVGPASVKGIELNPYAAELARVSVWIGEIQWMRRHGFREDRDPILKPLDTIECRDAVLTTDGHEPEWPEADVVIGNPPFLGGKLLRGVLGDDYVEGLQRLYGERIHGEADLVCHWFDKAERSVNDGKVARAGLVGTNSIRGGRNRSVLDGIVERGAIFDAWSDEPWVVDGAAVRVSLVCFAGKDAGLPTELNGEGAARINADLTSGTIDLSRAGRLSQNVGVAFMGDIKNGAFDIAGDQAREWLQLPSNPNGRPNSDVLKPWVNGMDLTRRPSGKWIIDFGDEMSESNAALYEGPFAHIAERVRPARRRNRSPRVRDSWWRHEATRPNMWQALDGLSRYIATPRLAKHRLFVWCDGRICPDSQLIVVARDDDTTFGVLHSRFHELWSLRLGTSLEDRPRYTPTTTFQTFPFPEGLSPDIPAADYADDPRAIAIAEAARALVTKRDRWLNPPEWVEWVDEPAEGYPKRPVLTAIAPPKELGRRTLTNLYNERPQWLVDAHGELDAAVAAAYGWTSDISLNDTLRELLKLNLT